MDWGAIMSLTKKPFQMENRGQLEKWLGQFLGHPDADSANIDVAKRLLSHGLGALDKVEQEKERFAQCHLQLHKTIAAIVGYYRWKAGDDGIPQSEIIAEIMSHAPSEYGESNA
jgi:hypothetical protein